MKRTNRIILAIGIAYAVVALAQEDKLMERQFVSPDGRFCVHLEKTEGAGGIVMTKVDLVAAKSGEELCELGTVGNPWAANIRVLWSPDSRRFAYVEPRRRGDWTELWVSKGNSFEELDRPDTPWFGGYSNLKGDHIAKTVLSSYSAVRWTKPDVLLIDDSCENDEGDSARMRVAVHFDASNRMTVTRVGGKRR